MDANVQNLKEQEDIILPLIEQYFDDNITQTQNQYDKYDFTSNFYNFELKSRKNKFNTYPTTMITKNKLTKTDKQLILLFNVGHIEAHSNKDNYSFVVNGLKNIEKLYHYFDKYEFIGIKGFSYLTFKELNKRIKNKEHLEEHKRSEMILLSHNINRKLSK